MLKCQLLAGAHFIFGGTRELSCASSHFQLNIDAIVLYAVGIVELELESTSAFVLLIFVIPLAFTLSGFLIWILHSLNGVFYPHLEYYVVSTNLRPTATIVQLKARKQRYKLKMFTRLYRILLLTVVIIAVFFVISSLSFSDRLAEGRPALSD